MHYSNDTQNALPTSFCGACVSVCLCPCASVPLCLSTDVSLCLVSVRLRASPCVSVYDRLVVQDTVGTPQNLPSLICDKRGSEQLRAHQYQTEKCGKAGTTVGLPLTRDCLLSTAGNQRLLPPISKCGFPNGVACSSAKRVL